MTLNTFFLEII